MRTRQEVRLVLVLVLVLALDVTSRAVAGDPYVWDTSRRPAPRAGTKFAEELEMAAVISKTLSHPGEEPTGQQKEQRENVRLVHSIGEVSPQGVTAEEIQVERWSFAEKGYQPDSSLEGLRIVVKGTGKERTNSVEGARAPSRFAKAWIERDLLRPSARDPGLDELDLSFLFPKDKVSEGSGWKLDPQELAKGLLPPGDAIDAAKSSASGKLASVKVVNGVHVGHLEIMADLALKNRERMVWDEGVVQRYRYVLDVSLEPDRRNDLSGTITIELKGKGTLSQGGAPVEVVEEQSFTITLRRSTVE